MPSPTQHQHQHQHLSLHPHRPQHIVPVFDSTSYARAAQHGRYDAASTSPMPSDRRFFQQTMHDPPRPGPRSYNTYPIPQQAGTVPLSTSLHKAPLPQLHTNFDTHSLPDYHEHQLRRKTPSGTIDNGYDGTPTQQASAQKHLIYYSRDVGHSVNLSRPQHTGSWYYSRPPPVTGHVDIAPPSYEEASNGYRSQANLLSAGYPSSVMPSPSPSSQMQSLSLGTPLHASFATYPPLGGASPAAPSPHPFNNPAGLLYADGPLAGGFLQPVAPPPMIYASSCYPPHNSPFESGFNAVQAPLPQGPLLGQGYGQNQTFHMPYMLNDGFAARHAAPPLPMLPSPHNLQNMALAASPAGSGSDQSLNFRDNILLQAHRAYLDLVAHATRMKKVQHGKSASRSLKSLIFPRPPKLLSVRPAALLQRSPQSFPGAVPTLHHRQSPVLGLGYGNMMLHQSNLPRESAKASFEMLRNLCEQSNWSWMDGMLMGGCLCYSLERYEDALDWFKRIVVLDKR